jgi:DNA polymerase V
VSISTSRFRAPFYGARAEVALETPTDSDITLIKVATGALSSIYREGHDYEKAEICLGGLSSAGMIQLRLFGERQDRGSALSRAADKLNGEAGRRLLLPAVLMGEKEWRPRKDRHSGTRLEDLEKLPMISGEMH